MQLANRRPKKWSAYTEPWLKLVHKEESHSSYFYEYTSPQGDANRLLSCTGTSIPVTVADQHRPLVPRFINQVHSDSCTAPWKSKIFYTEPSINSNASSQTSETTFSCLLIKFTLSTSSIPIIAAVKFGQQKNITAEREKRILYCQNLSNAWHNRVHQNVLMKLKGLSRLHHRWADRRDHLY